MTNALSDSRIAVLIDAENVSARLWPQIASAVSQLGRMALLRCFADYSNGANKDWLEVCRENAGQAAMVLSVNSTKNGADIALAIDAVDLIHAGGIDILVIASSDADFAPLARRTRASGVVAIGMGLQGAPKSLRAAFDDFVTLEPVSRSVPIETGALSSKDILRLSELFLQLNRQSPVKQVPLSHFGLCLKNAHPELWGRLRNGKLRKELQRNGICLESGGGTSIVLKLPN